MTKPTRILLARLTIGGLCVAVAAFIGTHYWFAKEPPPPEGVPEPPKPDTSAADALMERLRHFRQIQVTLNDDFEEGLRQMRAFMGKYADTGEAAEAHIVLARAYAKHGDSQAALAELSALLQMPDQGRRAPRALVLKAELLASSDEPAARDALATVRRDARFPDLQMRATLRLGLLDMAKGDYTKAIPLFKEVAATGVPERADAREALQEAAVGQAKKRAAAQEWQAVLDWAEAKIEEFPDLNAMRHALRYQQAVAYRHLSQHAMARTFIERLRRDVPADLLDEDIDLDAELGAITKAEEAAGVRRTRDAFLKAVQAAQDARAHFEGDIAADATWSKARSPLVLTGPVTVQQGATLTIEAGTVVQFLLGARLVVEGAVVARGTADQPIRFTSAAEKAPTFFDGGGIELADTSVDATCAFEHCVVEYQRVGLTCRAAQPAIRHCTFTRNGMDGLLLSDFVTLTLEGCTFEANDGNGLHAERSELVVRRCRVLKNGLDGLSFLGKSTPTIEANRVSGNLGNGITCDQDVAATIRGNEIADNKGNGIYANRFAVRTIQGNRLVNNGTGIRCERDSSPEITGNAILRSVGNGICLTRSSGAIRDNLIVGSRATAISLAQNASPTIEGNWVLMTHGASVQCGEGCAPTITRNAFAGFDPGALGTIGRMKITAPRNFFGRFEGRMAELRREPLKALEEAKLLPLPEEKMKDAIFDKADQPQLGEIAWRPRLEEPPPRPAMPELTDLP